jgi:uncharacterized protein YggE
MPVPRRRIPLVALIAATAAIAVPSAASAADAVDTTPLLSVVGQGTAFVTPDTADISASVTKTSPTSAPAREDVAQRTGRLLSALTALGIPRVDITTTNVTIARGTFRRKPKVRFTATVSISVHLTDVAKAGPTLDALTAAGADGVDGPNFGFSSPNAGAAQAEAAALADARARADAAAASAGLRVTGVRAIDLDPGSSGNVGILAQSAKGGEAAAPTADATPTPVQTGRQQVTASVAVVYTLG